MSLSCTVFEILWLISQKLKRSRDCDHAHFSNGLLSVVRDLLILWSTCPASMKSLRSPNTKIWKATQNVEIGVVWGGYGLPMVIGSITMWLPIWLTETSLCICRVPFCIIANYLSTVVYFNLPHLHLALTGGDPIQILPRSLASEN